MFKNTGGFRHYFGVPGYLERLSTTETVPLPMSLLTSSVTSRSGGFLRDCDVADIAMDWLAYFKSPDLGFHSMSGVVDNTFQLSPL
jgi:hypothetical protein